MRRDWFFSFLVVLVAGCGTASEQPPTPDAGKKTQADDVATLQAEFSLTADALYKEYKADENAAKAKFSGKIVEVTGLIKSVAPDPQRHPVVYLAAGKKLSEMLFCDMAEKEPWSKVIPGQIVKIKGRCADFFVPRLRNCIFVEPGPFQAIPITAKVLAREFESDPKGTVEKYGGQSLVITGEIAEKSRHPYLELSLRGTEKLTIRCGGFSFFFDNHMDEFFGSMKIGQEIKLVGSYYQYANENEVLLLSCNVIKGP